MGWRMLCHRRKGEGAEGLVNKGEGGAGRLLELCCCERICGSFRAQTPSPTRKYIYLYPRHPGTVV